jgi:tripartite-type tricarboxylate transporter receptor subunit TctC
VKTGKLRALATTGARRSGLLPEVPTVQEAGVPGYVEGNWQAVLVPAKTPRTIVDRLHQELVRIIKSPDITAQILKVGADVIASTPEETDARIRTDLKKYAQVIQRLDIRPE